MDDVLGQTHANGLGKWPAQIVATYVLTRNGVFFKVYFPFSWYLLYTLLISEVLLKLAEGYFPIYYVYVSSPLDN